FLLMLSILNSVCRAGCSVQGLTLGKADSESASRIDDVGVSRDVAAVVADQIQHCARDVVAVERRHRKPIQVASSVLELWQAGRWEGGTNQPVTGLVVHQGRADSLAVLGIDADVVRRDLLG